jgi:hypothetical protein
MIKPLTVMQLRAGKIPDAVDKPRKERLSRFQKSANLVSEAAQFKAAGVFVRLGTSLVGGVRTANKDP